MSVLQEGLVARNHAIASPRSGQEVSPALGYLPRRIVTPVMAARMWMARTKRSFIVMKGPIPRSIRNIPRRIWLIRSFI